MKSYGIDLKVLFYSDFLELFAAELNGQRTKLGRKPVAPYQSWASRKVERDE